MTIVDLFSGCGGMTLGAFEGARMQGYLAKVALAVDTNVHALDVYQRNFSVQRGKAICSGVEKVIPGRPGDAVPPALKVWAEEIGSVDFLLAGPPCQGHSNLNNHSRRMDPRNELYLSVIRAVELLSPRVVIIENVPGVVHDTSGVIYQAHADLCKLGYRVSGRVVEFLNFGVPQTRKRHLTVASRHLSSGELAHLLQPGSQPRSNLKSFIGDLEGKAEGSAPLDMVPRLSADNRLRIDWLMSNEAYDLPNYLRPPCHRDKAHSYKSMYGRLRWGEPAQTITTGFGSMGQGRYVHPTMPRTLTCHEAARIQGFPDFFDFSSVRSVTHLREMIGNAVPPQFVATVVSSALRGA